MHLIVESKLSYAPWLLAVQRWGGEVPAKLSRRDWRAAGMSLMRFLQLLWEFLNSGLTEITQVDGMSEGLGLLVGLTILALLLAVRFDRRRKTLLVIAAALVVPLMAAYPVWYMRPLAHPRYVLFLLAPLLVLVARTIAVLSRRRVLWVVGAALFAVVLTGDVVALSHGFFDPRFFRYDMRALSAAVAGRAVQGEAVIMPPGDYSLWYYDPAPAEPVNLPGEIGAEGGQLRPAELRPLMAGRPGAFLVRYSDLRTVDPRDQVPFLLENNGRLVERFSVDGMEVDHYELEPGWALPEPASMAVGGGPLTLTGVYSQAVARADNAVAVALHWRLRQPTDFDYKVAVRLWGGGRGVAGADVRLLNQLGRPTSRWEIGQEAVNYYVLPLPAGTPPLTYTLSARVYGGGDFTWDTGDEWLILGPVRLLQAVGQTTDPYGSWSGTEWHSPVVPEIAEGLSLEGYALRPGMLKPGDTLYVSLRWRAAGDDVASCMPALVLRQGDAVLARSTGRLFERYPTRRWAAGELLIETRQFPIPPTLAPLELALTVGGRTIPLREVSVARDALQWVVPTTAQPTCARLGQVAELRGYEWVPAAGQPGAWRLTLYWRALGDAPPVESYTVFAHLLSPDGLLLAQHDGLPSGGRRPTTSWLPGEVIADCHELLLNESYTGPARLRVGMYDLATVERLPAYDCAGLRFPSDAIPLAETVIEDIP